MKIRTTLLIALIFGLFATPTIALAGMKGSTEVGVFGGYLLMGFDSELGDGYYKDNVPGNALALGLRGSYALTEEFAAELELRFAPSALKRDDSSAPLLSPRLLLVAHLSYLNQQLRPFVLGGVGAETLVSGKDAPANDPNDKTVADADAALYIGAGIKWTYSHKLVLRAEFRQITVAGRADPWDSSFEFLFGAGLVFGASPPDIDKDGLFDGVDQCPRQAEDRDGFQDEDGCPEDDNDNDGIKDKFDKCPDKPETRNGIKDDDGCPDADSDKDGIADDDDQCKDMPEDKDGFKDDDGCPDHDNDGDKVPDAQDKCPNEAEDIDGHEDADGCPDRDNDLDGVPDDKDKCPKEKEIFNGYQDEDGCPDKVPKKVAKTFKGAIKGIQFESGSAEIKPSSFKVLNVALKVLQQFKSVHFEIAGHTDNTGKHDANMKLSQARAESVKAWFVGKGVTADRIEAKGYGDTKPVANNKSKSGRAKNRRIEFVLSHKPHATPGKSGK